MSIIFFGKRADGERIVLDLDNPAHLNLSNENARAFLLLLGLDDTQVLSGEMTLPDARVLVRRARREALERKTMAGLGR